MDVVALSGFAGLVVAAFGVRTFVHRRHTGSSGWLVPPTPAAWAGDGLFTVGLAGTLVGAALDVAGVIEPVDALDTAVVAVLGSALLSGGAFVALTAQAQMGAAWRAGIDVSPGDALVQRGWFGFVRNPFYLGMMLASAGAAFLTPSLLSAAAWASLVAGCETDVRLVEEPHLLAAHSAGYGRYAARVGRFLPLVGRLRSPSRGA